jgi:hypothetical protein
MSIGEVLTVYAYSMATNTRDDYPRGEIRLLPAVLIGSVVGPKLPIGRLNTRRQRYDEYIANVDDEFGRILNIMEERRVLENNYVVVISDHRTCSSVVWMDISLRCYTIRLFTHHLSSPCPAKHPGLISMRPQAAWLFCPLCSTLPIWTFQIGAKGRFSPD